MEKLNLETLEKWLWDSANILRGHIDSSDFKNYIFGLMFLKRASDQFFEEAKIAVEKEGIDLEEAIEDEDYHRFFIPKNLESSNSNSLLTSTNFSSLVILMLFTCKIDNLSINSPTLTGTCIIIYILILYQICVQLGENLVSYVLNKQ